LTLWKKEERFDAEQLKPQAARALHRAQMVSQVACLGGDPSVLRRWGSRESIHALIRRSSAADQHSVSGMILCPSDNPRKP
jgi:hypothetical protein